MIGAPILPMTLRVRSWLEQGHRVKIFTARVQGRGPDDLIPIVAAIQEWCCRHIGCVLDVTCVKDRHMMELWDDRAVAVETNTGRVLSPSRLAAEASPIHSEPASDEHARVHVEGPNGQPDDEYATSG